MRFSIFVLMIIITSACTDSTPEQASTQTQQTQELITDIPIISNNYDTWEGFWTAFQEAIKAQDKDKVKALCIFGENWTESTFEQQYELYIDANMRQIINTTPAKEVPASEILALSEVANLREIVFSESGVEEGIEYESALMLYFGKIEDRYGLIMWMAAG